MKAVLLSIAGLVLSVSSQAATLEQVVRAIAPAAQATGAAPGWSALDRLGVKWQHAGLKQTPAGYSRVGEVNLDGLGKTSVTFQGSRSEPHQASLSPPGKPQEESDGFGILKRLLPAAQIKQVRAACKHEGAVFSTAVYQVAVTGHRPAYVMLTVETNQQNFASTSMDIAAQFSKDWNCPP